MLVLFKGTIPRYQKKDTYKMLTNLVQISIIKIPILTNKIHK